MADFRDVLKRLPDPDHGFISLDMGMFIVSVQAGSQFASHPREDLADATAYEEFEVAMFLGDGKATWVTKGSHGRFWAPDHPWFPYVDARVDVFALRFAPTSVVTALLREVAMTMPGSRLNTYDELFLPPPGTT